MKKQQQEKSCRHLAISNFPRLLLVLSMCLCEISNTALCSAAENPISMPTSGMSTGPAQLLTKAQENTDLPTSDAKHDINKSLNVDKLRLHSAVHL